VHIDDFINDRAMDEHEGLFARTVTAHLDGDDAPVGFYAMTVGPEPADLFTEEQSFLERIKTRFSRGQLTTVQLIWVAVPHKNHGPRQGS
jgi:hypothetical protein